MGPESTGKILQQYKCFIFRHAAFRLNIIHREDVFYDTKTKLLEVVVSSKQDYFFFVSHRITWNYSVFLTRNKVSGCLR